MRLETDAPVAQLDRASAFEAEGREFESLRARHLKPILILILQGRSRHLEVDLHGFHPSQILRTGFLHKLVQQSWEMGEIKLTLIHGHGRNRGISPGFVNTNTGYFGLCIRRALRQDESSVVGSKAANGGQVKTGQRMWPGTWFFYPIFS